MAEEQVLVTGATGFVGGALCRTFDLAGIPYRRALRRAEGPAERVGRGADVVVGDIGPETHWREALLNVSTVVHLAGRAHVFRETASDPMSVYRRINVEGTDRLAQAAADAGVKRMVFVSSIKVNGERTQLHPFRDADEPRPEDNYGKTKWEAEQRLRRIAGRSELSVTVLRPPLVYGPGVKGNFLVLMHAVDRGLPLPLASVNNRRSLIYAGNLASAIVACLNNSRSLGQTFLVSDGVDASTPEIILRMAAAMGRKARLYPFPPALLDKIAKLFGRGEQAARLTGSLQVDASLIRSTLGWQPPFSMQEGLEQTASWYQARSG